ncbi:MAG: leucyl aminopeptidase [Alphaproteobacteria bacterium]|jgi:leucyl aminopeptidase
MSIFNNNPLCSVTLNTTKLKTKNVLHILTDADMKRADLPLPRLGRKRISSKLGKVSYMDEGDTAHVIIGAGNFDENEHLTIEQWFVTVGATIFEALKAEEIDSINLADDTFMSINMVYGLGIRAFTNGEKTNTIKIGNVRQNLHEGMQMAQATNFGRLLTNTPHGAHRQDGSNSGLNSQSFAKLLMKEFPKNDITDHICKGSRNALAKIGAGGLLSVGKASEFEPALLDVTYRHPECTDKPIIFVAKGVMYDTGGAAIKPGSSMATMKYDMTASSIAAAVLKNLRDSKAKCHVKVIFCLTDNAVSSDMTYNGDHVKMMDGQIVEVTNTDAEGRMVLFDGLVYAQHNYPNAKCYLSSGTLTGTGRGVSGTRSAMYFCRDELLNNKLQSVIHECGQVDEFFRLPVDLRKAKVVKSPEPGVDLKNSVQGVGTSASETAYNFLKASMKDNNEMKYIHIDIANVGGGYHDITGLPLPYFTGTGWGVYTLSHLFTTL